MKIPLGEITIKDIVGWVITIIFLFIMGGIMYQQIALKDQQISNIKESTSKMIENQDQFIKNLENQKDDYEKRYNQLKNNLDRMKTEADKLANKCRQTTPSDQSAKNIEEKIDDIYRNAIPLSYKIGPQQVKEEAKEHK